MTLACALPVASQAPSGRPLSTQGAPAAPSSSGPAWTELSPAHQAALAPLKGRWPAIDDARKAKWIAMAERFPSMPAAERARVQARMAEWAALPPGDRGRARQNFQELRTRSPDDRQASWEAYQALPEEQKRALAQRAKPPLRPPEATAANPANTTNISKRSLEVNPTPAPVTVRPVTPTVVQANPGATTSLLGKSAAPPPHHQPGLPKINAGEGFVNPATLLPSRGPQGAATIAQPASAASAPARKR
jgi:hypothetical protein